jgi:hypothetical protein
LSAATTKLIPLRFIQTVVVAFAAFAKSRCITPLKSADTRLTTLAIPEQFRRLPNWLSF